MAAPCNWDLTQVCCADWGTFSPTVQAAATAAATLVLWAATGRQFGLCENTVRPCGRFVGSCPDNRWGWWLNGSGTWLPYIDTEGVWRNCGCGFSGCGCQPDCQVYLPGPVDSVSSVYQNSFLVDPTAYRVDDGHWLVRTDGDCWPDCVDLNRDLPGENVFQVTYLRGTPIPPALLAAAGIYACEWAKACTGGNCRLPGRVSSIVRQGVSVSLVDTDTLLNRGLTGLLEVDQVIVALNPRRLPYRLRVWSPDRPNPRTVTSP